MQAGQLFDYLPLWGLFFATVLLILLSVEGGFRLGRYRRRRNEHEQHAPVGSIVGATLGLLALMLAFTFGRAISHYDARRHLVLDEANAIGATYLRAELLPKPQRTEIRKLLREYVTVRVKSVQTREIEQNMGLPGRKSCRPGFGLRPSPSARKIPGRSLPGSSSNR